RRPATARDWPGVEHVLDRTARALHGSPEVDLVRAEALVAQGRPDGAGELLARARDRRPDRIDLWTALADLAARQEAFETAASRLKEAEGRFGDRLELRLARIDYWARRGGGGGARGLAPSGRETGARPGGGPARLAR